MRFAARFFTFFSIFYFLFSIFVTSAHAQYYPTTYTNPYTTPNTNPDVPSNLHTYTQSIILEVLSGITCQIIGIDPSTSSHECLGFDTTTGKIGYVPSNGGAIGFVGNMISSLYTPPINTSSYLNYVASNFGLVKHTYADSRNGIGFDGLTPLLGLWTTFRNISYLIFVIVFIAIGFAIMLRVKIDPRTVMSIENQIPKLIITLLLVTFSYAIAGFLIDMMYVATYLTVNIVSSSQAQPAKDKNCQANNTPVCQIHNAEKSDLVGGNPLGFANDIIPGGILGISLGSAGGVKDVVQSLFTPAKVQGVSNPSGGLGWGLIAGGATGAACIGIGILTAGIGAIPCLLLGATVGVVTGITVGGVDVGDMVTAALGTVVEWAAGVLAFFIIVVAILIAMFRLWFSLLLAYVSILLDIVLAPFFITIGIFPGSKIGFGMWFKDIVSNLIAFPVAVAMFLLAGLFMNNFATNSSGFFTPPLIGNPNASTVGAQSPVAYLIALGMIMLTPNVVTMMKELLGAPKQQYLQSIVQGLGAGAGIVINSARGATRTRMAGEEYIAGAGGRFERRGVGRALLQGVLGGH